MKISKIINNNVVSTCDEEGREVIVMGRGIGFKAREGSTIDEEKIEKVFRLDSQNTMDKFKELLVNLPMEHVQISAEIISYAKEVLNRPINPNVYITLTDHINFALERFNQRMMFSNPLIREVRSFYHAEYLIGEYAIAMIDRDLGIKLPVDEAASIALHIVNAEYDAPMGDTIKITNLIQQVSEVVEEYFNIKLDEQSLSYERFITHLRFLAQRVFTGEHMELDNLEFQKVIDRLYPEEYACSQKVQALIKLQYGHQVTEEEVAYLALHIKRIRTK
ncbi:PRD domain-containing protein [Clostridiales bacterium TF09-2AC]|nr:PRD domain-containing protein [Clostridiales bacterium TF09-2AC]